MINTPFNYTGSKFKLLEQLLPELDYTKKTFYDVFTGGGSVYANVLDKYDKIMINDIITDLILIHYNLINNKNEFLDKVIDICPKKR